MMINKEAAQQILGFEESVCLTPEEMAKDLTITIFPFQQPNLSPAILAFADRLIGVFRELGVRFIDFEEALDASNPKRKALKRRVSVLVIGDQPSDNLPIEYITSLSDNSLVSILDYPQQINEHTPFAEHFETAMTFFSHHLTNIVLGVDDQKWILYNYNASHPIYQLSDRFQEHVLHSLIPKIYAPISPCKLSEFDFDGHFDPKDELHQPLVDDFIRGGALFEQTGLYPPRRDLDSFPFRSTYHRRVAKMLLDGRNGMSYGFMARQLPGELVAVRETDAVQPGLQTREDGWHLALEAGGKMVELKVPEVWVLSQRSGADKTRLDPHRDLLKMGLRDGQMLLQTPHGVALEQDYRPSFDTKVILALSVGNAMVAALQHFFQQSASFAQQFAQDGLALAHWHGYFRQDLVPPHTVMYGADNPNVACSSPQGAMYALQGKLAAFDQSLRQGRAWQGDIHIEPQHGINITVPSLQYIAKYLLDHPLASVLGSKYFYAFAFSLLNLCWIAGC